MEDTKVKVMEDTKVKCAKCFKEMEEGKYKTCDKCREYMRANHQKNKEKYNERRRRVLLQSYRGGKGLC